MARYNRLPQHYDDDYDICGDDDDDDDDEIDTCTIPSIVSITVTRHEKTDGSIVRVKETLLPDGTSKRQEEVVIVPPRHQSRPKTTGTSCQQQKQTTANNFKYNNNNRTKSSSFVDVGLWDEKYVDLHENWDDNDDNDDGGDGVVKFDFGKGSKNDSLRIWPVSFWDEDMQRFNSLTTVLPLKYKLNQSSDSRTRVYLSVFRYVLKIITVVALLVALAWFLKSIVIDELLYSIINNDNHHTPYLRGSNFRSKPPS